MLSRIKAPDIRNVPPIAYLSEGKSQEGGPLIALLDTFNSLAVLWGLPVQAMMRYGFGSRYFINKRIVFSALALLVLIFVRHLYVAVAATWESWAIEGNIINYAIGVVLLLSLIMSLRSFVLLFLFWLGYMVLIADHNPLTLFIEAVDGFFSFSTLTGVAVLVGAMVLHHSLAAYWERTTPEDKHIHSHYYGRWVFWHLYPSDAVNTLLMEPLLLLGVYFMVDAIAPDLAFYVAVLGVSAFLLAWWEWHAAHRYYQNHTDGKRYSTDQLDETEGTPQQVKPEPVAMAGVIKKKP